jgi:hypothetical protein
MDESNLVRRTQQAAWRSSGTLPESLQHRWHAEDLRSLGRDEAPLFDGKQAHDEVEGWGDVFAHPVAIIFLALLTFGMIFSALLWHEGKLDKFLASGASQTAQSTASMGRRSGGDAIAIDEPDMMASETPPNEMEAALSGHTIARNERELVKLNAAAEPELAGEIIDE